MVMTPFCLDQLRGEAANGQQLSCHQAQPGGEGGSEDRIALLWQEQLFFYQHLLVSKKE